MLTFSKKIHLPKIYTVFSVCTVTFINYHNEKKKTTNSTLCKGQPYNTYNDKCVQKNTVYATCLYEINMLKYS